MPEIVIVACRPKPGHEDDLVRLARGHHARLAELGLVTDRAPVLMQATDGTVVEVFEWQDGAVSWAHGMVEIQALWAEYAAISDYVPLAELPETEDLFAAFTPL